MLNYCLYGKGYLYICLTNQCLVSNLVLDYSSYIAKMYIRSLREDGHTLWHQNYSGIVHGQV